MSRHTVHTAYWSAILQTALVTHSLTVLNQLHSLQLQIVNMQLYSTASQPNKYSHQQFLFLTLFHITYRLIVPYSKNQVWLSKHLSQVDNQVQNLLPQHLHHRKYHFICSFDSALCKWGVNFSQEILL